MLIYFVVVVGFLLFFFNLYVFSICDAKENSLFLSYSWTICKKERFLLGGLVMAGWPIKMLL